MKNIEISPIQSYDYKDLSIMVGELLNEIMNKICIKAFNYNSVETEIRAKNLVSNKKYWVFIARDLESQTNVGFVSLYESFALYAEGAYGTIPELYVRPNWRSGSVGKNLLKRAFEFAAAKGWRRLEVTTPPLPEFDKTLHFYQLNGFEISGGRKLSAKIYST